MYDTQSIGVKQTPVVKHRRYYNSLTMASSRWKRFAFFDRQTLTIPSDVTDDLIPSTETSSSSLTVGSDERQQQKQSRNNEIDRKDSDFISETTSGGGVNEVTRSIRSLTLAGEESLRNDSVSLIVATAALPFLSRPVTSSSYEQSQQTGSQTKSETQSSNATESEDSNTSALEAMWSSLSACTSSPFDPNVFDKSIELPSQAQQNLTQTSNTGNNKSSQSQHEQQGSSNMKDNKGNNSNASGALDGLVLCFVTSKNTNLVHCFDLTVRCNSQSSDASRVSAAKTNESSIRTVVAGSNDAANDKKDRNTPTALDDLDGWRGYFAPIPPQLFQQNERQQPPTTRTSSQQEIIRSNDGTDSANLDVSLRVLGIAACRCPDRHGPLHVASISNKHLTVWEDPHLHLLCRKPFRNNTASIPGDAVVYTATSARPGTSSQQQLSLRSSMDGDYRVVDIVPGIVAVGTSTGVVMIYVYTYQNAGTRKTLRPFLRIPSPPGVSGIEVVSVKLSLSLRKALAFVSYNRNASSIGGSTSNLNNSSNNQSTTGICCYEIPTYNIQSSNTISAPSARHDLDGRYVSSSALIGSFASQSVSTDDPNSTEEKLRLAVARPDGIYSYSRSERIGVAPIDGPKQAICLIPPPVPVEKSRDVALTSNLGDGCGYVLVASTDMKSGRDAVDIYDIYNNLVAFHLLLSPGHRALRAFGITTISSESPRHTNASGRRGQSSAVVLTSGGLLVTLIEKKTEEKITLLIQKNLYSAAIAVAYSDPSYDASDVTALYQAYAEYLYGKGDFSGAIEQYMHTIGSIETSHVIFRYLDAPKIPFLVKYLEKLRSLSVATPVHNDLLRTCYLKLNDTQAAETIGVSSLSRQSMQSSRSPSNLMSTILTNLTTNPKEALVAVCALDASQAAEVLAAHGASLARAHPRETAGIVISLCLGTYSPNALAEVALGTNPTALYKMLQYQNTTMADHPKHCEAYPVQAFLPRTFVEHPKMLRLVLAHCNRNKVPLTACLRRTLLELTLAEWNQAKRSGDSEAVKLRRKEAIAALTDSHSRDIGDYDALVLVQLAGFEEGELLLYERLQMTPMLLERYAADGSEKSRRRMLAMCQTDPEILADVLKHFVAIASEKLNREQASNENSETDELEEIMDEIQECLALAKRQGVLPPVRIARILAGEHSGQFRCDLSLSQDKQHKKTVPLSVALDYIGTILDESRTEIIRLKNDVEEYNQLCNAMENEIDSLLRVSGVLPPTPPTSTENPQTPKSLSDTRLNVDDLYARIRNEDPDQFADRVIMSEAKEAFWREINQSEDPFETISRFFAKGVII